MKFGVALGQNKSSCQTPRIEIAKLIMVIPAHTSGQIEIFDGFYQNLREHTIQLSFLSHRAATGE